MCRCVEVLECEVLLSYNIGVLVCRCVSEYV